MIYTYVGWTFTHIWGFSLHKFTNLKIFLHRKMPIHPTHDVEYKKFNISNVRFLVTFMLDGHMLDGQNS